MKAVTSIIIIVVFAIAAGSIILYFCQDALIFYPQPINDNQRSKFAKYEITFDHNGVRLHGWFIKRNISKNNPLLVYYGGNAEEVSGNLCDLDNYNTQSFLFMNYRGYGASQGKPTQKNLYRDALFILDNIVKANQIDWGHIVLMGRSLGTGVAVFVAFNRRVAGVILVSPFDSLLNIAKHHYPIFPVSWLLVHRFESQLLAPKIKSPVLNIMAGNDQTIPNKNSQNLIKCWGGPSESVVIKGATHNDISNCKLYWDSINEFL